MDFRYRLAKKTFKNKKIPQKRAPGMDVISPDQRGDDSSPEISPLSLDKHTITQKPKPPEEERQLSRRDLFSFGSFMKSAAELNVKPIEETDGEEHGLPEHRICKGGHAGSDPTADGQQGSRKEVKGEKQQDPEENAIDGAGRRTLRKGNRCRNHDQAIAEMLYVDTGGQIPINIEKIPEQRHDDREYGQAEPPVEWFFGAQEYPLHGQ